MVNKNEIIESYKKTNNMSETAREFGISREYVRQVVNQIIGTPKSRRSKTDGITEETFKKIYEKQSPTDKVLREKLNINQQTLTRLKKKLGVQRPKMVGVLNPKRTVEKVLDLYYNKGMKQADIAKKFGYAGNTSVSAIIRKYGNGKTQRNTGK